MPPDHAGDRELLLATKLRVPEPRAGLVERPHLVDQLEAALASGVVLVSAPAGSGKSTLLAQWARQTQRRVAWVSLDPADSDPARFWRHAVAALEARRPGLERELAPWLRAADQAPPGALPARLANLLAAGPTSVVLVLDDHQAIEPGAVGEGLGLLAEHLPPGLRLVIATRTEPPFPLTRWRARGSVAELRAEDLRFTAGEAAALLRDASGRALPDEQARLLQRRTEGWATGLHLAALALRRHPDAGDFIRRFGASHRYVLDYLTEEVLEREPEPVRRFLLDTSILARLRAELCDAVTGRGDGAEMLARLERDNLFLVPLDEERRWYRYHNLFAGTLRARLGAADPDRAVHLQRRAAAWFESRGLIDEAIAHALAAGEARHAAALVEEHFDELLRRGEGATLRAWVELLPADAIRARPRLCVVEALGSLSSGRIEAVEPLLAAAEHGLAQGGGGEAPAGARGNALANLPASIANLRASVAALRGDAGGAERLARRARGLAGPGDGGAALPSGWNLALVDWMRGRLDEAERAFAELVALGLSSGPPHLALSACAHLGRIQRARGRLGAALASYRRTLDALSRPDAPTWPTAGALHLGIAAVLYERDRLGEARREAESGIALSRRLTATGELAAGLSTLAWVRHATGDAEGALAAMGEAARVHPGEGIVSVFNPVPAEWARLELARGRVAPASAWIEELGLADGDEPSYAREREHLTLARLRLAQGTPERALPLLERLGALAQAQGRAASSIEVLVLRALAHQGGGDPATATATLLDALRLAEPERCIRVVADEGAPVRALLGALARRARRDPSILGDVSLDHVTRVLAATRRSPGSDRAAPALVEELTDREAEVLGMLAAGRRNREIADSLVVTLDTVKKHLTHTFGKLGARNRTEAVARARDLGLLG